MNKYQDLQNEMKQLTKRDRCFDTMFADIIMRITRRHNMRMERIVAEMENKKDTKPFELAVSAMIEELEILYKDMNS